MHPEKRRLLIEDTCLIGCLKTYKGCVWGVRGVFRGVLGVYMVYREAPTADRGYLPYSGVYGVLRGCLEAC